MFINDFLTNLYLEIISDLSQAADAVVYRSNTRLAKVAAGMG
jgi:hypothetical protein